MTTPKTGEKRCTGKEFEPGTCGVVWRGANLKRIEFCPLHAAAPDLLAALLDGLEVWDVVGETSERRRAWFAATRAAIAKAEGR